MFVSLLTGIVHSNLVLTFFQVASRQFILWGVIHAVPGVSTCQEGSTTPIEQVQFKLTEFSLMRSGGGEGGGATSSIRLASPKMCSNYIEKFLPASTH